MRSLERREDIWDAQRQLEAGFIQGATPFPGHEIRFRPRTVLADVYWHPKLEVWGSLNAGPPSGGQRFWNVFGTQGPSLHQVLRITCEANPPHQGIEPKLGGVFARDERGKLFLLHRGFIGGGRKGMGKSFFWDNTNAHAVSLADDGECVIVASLGSRDTAVQLAGFINDVHRIKGLS